MLAYGDFLAVFLQVGGRRGLWGEGKGGRCVAVLEDFVSSLLRCFLGFWKGAESSRNPTQYSSSEHLCCHAPVILFALESAVQKAYVRSGDVSLAHLWFVQPCLRTPSPRADLGWRISRPGPRRRRSCETWRRRPCVFRQGRAEHAPRLLRESPRLPLLHHRPPHPKMRILDWEGGKR